MDIVSLFCQKSNDTEATCSSHAPTPALDSACQSRGHLHQFPIVLQPKVTHYEIFGDTCESCLTSFQQTKTNACISQTTYPAFNEQQLQLPKKKEKGGRVSSPRPIEVQDGATATKKAKIIASPDFSSISVVGPHDSHHQQQQHQQEQQQQQQLQQHQHQQHLQQDLKQHHQHQQQQQLSPEILDLIKTKGFLLDNVLAAKQHTDGSLDKIVSYLWNQSYDILTSSGFDRDLVSSALTISDGSHTRALRLINDWKSSSDPLFDHQKISLFPTLQQIKKGQTMQVAGSGACLWLAFHGALSVFHPHTIPHMDIKHQTLAFMKLNRYNKILIPSLFPHAPITHCSPDEAVAAQMDIRGTGTIMIHSQKKPVRSFNSFDSYFDTMAHPTAYGEHVEIMGLAACHSFNIIVLVPQTKLLTGMALAKYQETNVLRYFPTSDPEPAGTIVLINSDGDSHYDWVRV